MVTRDRSNPLSPRDYHTIFHNASDGLVVHPPDSGDIVDANERYAEMVGYTRSELLERSVEDVTADDWVPPVSASERIQQAGDAGQIKFEWRNQHRDGTAFWVEVNLTAVELQGEECILSSVRDISDRKQQERRARAIFDQTYQFTGLMERDGTLIEANQAALEFGGLDREDVIGKPVWECYWFQLSESLQERIERSVERAAGGEFVRYDVEVQGAEGTEVIDFSIRPMVDESGDVDLLIPEGRVISEKLKQRQRLDIYNRVFRHNLRNQLTVIDGYTDHIKDRTDDERLSELADNVLSASARLHSLAEQIRDFDRLERQDPVPERINVGQLVEELATGYADRDGQPAVVADATENLEVRARVPLLREALDQVVENAVEHGGSRVRIAATLDPETTEHVVITVTDDGPGIPESEIEPVLDGNATQLEHTTGIGLWTVKWCVDELNGTLSFDRTAEGDTSVTIRLPIAA